ncbi:MAG: hypothetical protein UT66_C0018G0030 [candidate division CPR2 bacterium GW2011_GWC1_39_9]|uniref:Uncharacterized protein n=1 Tax=candidate division CPR2 bacterium GW2011_GWC2_39_10 TaxID=1618345 RepID=A0A0G0LSE3_UNCC2|nr:MAG: hypothetical protein UT18_C0013G0004 [candidate division CPR2 bacterium GW2011_GWC2_39_10]KKR34691.1 MAG: hypothetical protein UT66_C0018G0030 [candidate division CPR2 bacterium GW2011_GWC1_39_9]
MQKQNNFSPAIIIIFFLGIGIGVFAISTFAQTRTTLKPQQVNLDEVFSSKASNTSQNDDSQNYGSVGNFQEQQPSGDINVPAPTPEDNSMTYYIKENN